MGNYKVSMKAALGIILAGKGRVSKNSGGLGERLSEGDRLFLWNACVPDIFW